MNTNDFVNREILKTEHRLFIGHILSLAMGYVIITLWLNHIRATASLWLVWPLIIIQLLLYFGLFTSGYNRSKVFGLNKNIAFIIFLSLAVLGRINDLELLVIPLLLVVMFILSVRNKNVSIERQHLLRG